MAVRTPFDTDTWWHIRSGQYIVEQWTIPATDPFSFTRQDHPWIDHGWSAQIFWYGLYALGGWAVVSLGLAGLVTLAFWFVWRQIEGNIFVAALGMVLGAIVSSVVWAARPQMISFLLTAIVAYLLHRFKRHDGRLLPWLPLIMLVWANIHGGFAIGFMLMGAYLVGELLNRLTRHEADPVVDTAGLKYLALTIGLSLAAMVVNPYTWRMWVYPFQTVGIGALRDFIVEWRSPDFHLNYVQPFAVMLLLVLVAMARAGRRADWTDLTLVSLWTAWGLFAARNIAIFGLVVTPILVRYADLAWTAQWQLWGYDQPPFAAAATSRRGARGPLRVVNWLLLSLIGIAALIKIALPLQPRTTLQVERDSMPYEAVEFIRAQRPQGPMLNSYNWGGYLIFKLWPDYPVYIDGRTDLYDDLFIRRYLRAAVADEDWPEILRTDGINLVVIEQDSTLAKFLRQEPGWRQIYRDDMAAIFSRTSPLP